MTVTDAATELSTLSEEEFRAPVRSFLEGRVPRRRSKRDADGGDAEEDAPLVEAGSAASIGAAQAYQAALFDAGLAFLTWPERTGGAEVTKRHGELFNEVASDYEIPNFIFQIGHGMCAPTILEIGTDDQKDRYLRPLLRGDVIWCQLYSEPGAGSDVASRQTRAVRDGDEFVVNGQKVWTSGAHYSGMGILIARTNPDAPKHRGRRHRRPCGAAISKFIVDMETPGIEAKPLRQITGRRQLPRGVLHRRPHPGREPARHRGRRLAPGGGAADERAGGHRRLWAAGPATVACSRSSAGLAPPASSATRSSARSWWTAPSGRR
jgi:alkylation response protein AidB-like acyl-CoA dehydrogenase